MKKGFFLQAIESRGTTKRKIPPLVSHINSSRRDVLNNSREFILDSPRLATEEQVPVFKIGQSITDFGFQICRQQTQCFHRKTQSLKFPQSKATRNRNSPSPSTLKPDYKIDFQLTTLIKSTAFKVPRVEVSLKVEPPKITKSSNARQSTYQYFVLPKREVKNRESITISKLTENSSSKFEGNKSTSIQDQDDPYRCNFTPEPQNNQNRSRNKTIGVKVNTISHFDDADLETGTQIGSIELDSTRNNQKSPQCEYFPVSPHKDSCFIRSNYKLKKSLRIAWS